MGRPEKLLADRVRDPKAWANPYIGRALSDPLSGFDKIVLDEEAATMMVQLSHLPPKDADSFWEAIGSVVESAPHTAQELISISCLRI